MLRPLFLLACVACAQTPDTFDALSFTVPKGWTVERNAVAAIVQYDNGRQYAKANLLVPRPAEATHQATAAADWQFHAAKFGPAQPASVNTTTRNGWQITTASAVASFKGQPLYITVATYTSNGLAHSAIHFGNDAALLQIATAIPVTCNAPQNAPDTWTPTAKPAYVELTNPTAEVRLYYINDALDKSRPNTVGPPEHYWAAIVEPAFRTANLQKYEGVNYPPVYFMEATAQDRQTGKAVYVAMKIVYAGGARVIVAITPNQSTHRRHFPHPNDMDRMLALNKFPVTAAAVRGTWVRNAGGGVEYYNAYSGTYAGMAANSTTDEFTFNADTTYRSTHRYANTANGATRFSGLDYQGRFSLPTPWELHATNRVDGKTKKFWARLEAVRGGYLLVLTDSDYEPLQYILYRTP